MEGGGAGSRPDGQKQSGRWFYCCCFLSSPTYFTEWVQWFYKENFSEDPEGVQLFSGGGGPNARNPSRGVRTPYPPSGSAHENLHDVIMAQ